jgi:hypothetical protein
MAAPWVQGKDHLSFDPVIQRPVRGFHHPRRGPVVTASPNGFICAGQTFSLPGPERQDTPVPCLATSLLIYVPAAPRIEFRKRPASKRVQGKEASSRRVVLFPGPIPKLKP